MNLTFTEPAIERIRSQYNSGEGVLKLAYDNEGCGCAVNGVPALWIVDGSTADEFQLDAAPFAVWMENKHAVYFEERLRIDYDPIKNRLMLKSDQQIYNANMQLTDRRGLLRQP